MQEFIEYLTAQAEAANAKIDDLEASGRADDAAFAKVKANIYDVCKTVSLALVDRPGFGIGAIKARFEGFQTSWGTALEKAREHGDVRAVAVEETKLAALADAIAHFPEV